MHKVGVTPPDPAKVAAVARGEMNAIFEEAAPRWVGAALDAGMTILPLSETMVQKLEAMGHRRAVLKKATFPKLPVDVMTMDFSGLPIFMLADLPDAQVTQICVALEARKNVIPWQEAGPLPLADMCRNTPAAPLSVPFHPAAERFWRERGYLPEPCSDCAAVARETFCSNELQWIKEDHDHAKRNDIGGLMAMMPAFATDNAADIHATSTVDVAGCTTVSTA